MSRGLPSPWFYRLLQVVIMAVIALLVVSLSCPAVGQQLDVHALATYSDDSVGVDGAGAGIGFSFSSARSRPVRFLLSGHLGGGDSPGGDVITGTLNSGLEYRWVSPGVLLGVDLELESGTFVDLALPSGLVAHFAAISPGVFVGWERAHTRARIYYRWPDSSPLKAFKIGGGLCWSRGEAKLVHGLCIDARQVKREVRTPGPIARTGTESMLSLVVARF